MSHVLLVHSEHGPRTRYLSTRSRRYENRVAAFFRKSIRHSGPMVYCEKSVVFIGRAVDEHNAIYSLSSSE